MTPLQIKTLQAVADGSVVSKNYGTGAWRIDGANPSTVGRLMSQGMARWTKWPGGVAELTDAGRAALSHNAERG